MTHRSARKAPGLLLALVFFLGILLFAFCASAESGSLLDTGPIVNTKIRYVTMGEDTEKWIELSAIRAIRMADSLPDGFVPSESNTVSAADSCSPIYIFFDNKDDAGILYFYTESGRIIMNSDSRSLFIRCTALTDISGIADWDASRVVSMRGMFAYAASLPDALALRNWDTSSVTDMGFMFSGASSLMYIDVSGWNTSNVISMSNMFQVGDNHMGNGQLREILGIGNWDVSKVTDMTCMFYGAGSMTYYDVSGWDVSSVESMNHMFCDNYRLRSLDLSAWDVSSLKTIFNMFDDCQALKTIGDVSHWNTSSLIDAGGWLNYATSFIGDNTGLLDLSGWDTRKLKAVGEMFLYTQVRVIDLTGWTFDAISNGRWEGAGHGIYYECGNGNSSLKAFGEMFRKTPSLMAVYVSREGLDSFNDAVERGLNTENMWQDSNCEGFTVK